MSTNMTSQATRFAKSNDVIQWVVWLGRFGYAAKGIVYIIIGALAIQVALGSGGQTTGPSGALDTIARQAYGQILLLAIAVGLFGYALWRFIQAWVDPEHEGSDAKGMVKRSGYTISGIVYGLLGVEAIRLVIGSSAGGSGDGGGDQQAQDWTATLMAQPFGQWLVAIVGLILIGVGLYQGYRAYSAKFKQKLKLHEMSVTEQRWATRSGRLGFAARGVVYLMLGGFLIQAALTHNPEEAGGIGRALGELASQPYGPWLLGIVAAGLVAYGFFCFVLARYRRIFIG
jgi:hypothetical protein